MLAQQTEAIAKRDLPEINVLLINPKFLNG
jgi:hypothetical protein